MDQAIFSLNHFLFCIYIRYSPFHSFHFIVKICKIYFWNKFLAQKIQIIPYRFISLFILPFAHSFLVSSPFRWILWTRLVCVIAFQVFHFEPTNHSTLAYIINSNLIIRKIIILSIMDMAKSLKTKYISFHSKWTHQQPKETYNKFLSRKKYVYLALSTWIEVF